MPRNQEKFAIDVYFCMDVVVPWLEWPIAATTLFVLSLKCYRQRRLRQALPLLATQLNSALIWCS